MNFTTVVAEVQRLTKRPDLLADIQREVNAAINFTCIETTFARDISEDLYPIDGTLYTQSLPLSDFPEWRKFLYIRPSNRNKYLEHLTADKIFNPSGKEASDVYYIAGDNVQFKMCSLSTSLIIGYAKYPPVLTNASPNFWLLEVSPYMIIAKAAGAIFTQVGNSTEGDKQLATYATLVNSAIRDYKYGVSYG